MSDDRENLRRLLGLDGTGEWVVLTLSQEEIDQQKTDEQLRSLCEVQGMKAALSLFHRILEKRTDMKGLFAELIEMLETGMVNQDVDYGSSCHFCERVNELGRGIAHADDCRGMMMLSKLRELAQ